MSSHNLRYAPGAYERLESATADLDPPFALVDMDAFWANADDLVRRASGKPIRVASKSVRCRELQERVLSRAGFRGTLAFTLPEAIWLAQHGSDDILVAYPTASAPAIARLARLLDERPDLRLAVMIDNTDHLDLIDAAAPRRSTPIQVCIEVDAGWWVLKGRVRIGAKRSPLRTAEDAAALARAVVDRPGFTLVGLMAYESQIAGVADAPPGRRLRGVAIRRMQSASARELSERRSEVVQAVESVTPLAFVNGGGTGSVDLTAAEESVTEIAAGSGLFAPALFSGYSRFDPRPAALFAVPIVRRPRSGVATALGGGYLASGPADDSRLPEPYLPVGLKLDKQEGAGEVQTPLLGPAADRLQIGDRVYFRHAKAGEMCERFKALHLIEDGRIVDEVPTYRGEGRCFL